MIHQCQTIANLINQNYSIMEAQVVNDFLSRDIILHSPVLAKTDRHIFILIAYIGIMLQKFSRLNDGGGGGFNSIYAKKKAR